MCRYLREGQYEEIIQLRRDQGMMVKDLAKKYGVCDATISNICKGTAVPRGGNKIIKPPPSRKIPDACEIEFVDFSILPDHVLFQHVREYNFIG